MPFRNEPEYLGTGREDYTVRQFMFVLSDKERVDFIINFLQLEDRKGATDRNYQMKLYWLDGIRGGAARPAIAILQGWITTNLTIDGDSYTFCADEAQFSALIARNPSAQFSQRANSFSDDISASRAYIEGYYLHQLAVLTCSGDFASWYISSTSN